MPKKQAKPPQKIGFHSYKGGVGRSKLLIGLGALLASRGKRVGLLDFDLDAAGLATMFGATAEDVGERELLSILKDKKQYLVLDALRDETSLVKTRFEREELGNGCLKYIPTISDPTLADDIKFGNELKLTVREIFDLILEKGGVDLLLIDTKPGFSPTASLVLPMVDRAVVAARIDNQNIAGLSQTVPHLQDVLKLAPILVANFVPDSDRADKRLSELEKRAKHEIDVRIGYDPELTFDDDFQRAADGNSQLHFGLSTIAQLLGFSDEE